MALFRSNGDRVPSAIEAMAKEARAGRMDRREFLALASAFGASVADRLVHAIESSEERGFAAAGRANKGRYFIGVYLDLDVV